MMLSITYLLLHYVPLAHCARCTCRCAGRPLVRASIGPARVRSPHQKIRDSGSTTRPRSCR
ncbi:hypothetical protein [Frankia sp. CcWB3]